MRRRAFVVGAALGIAAPGVARAQPAGKIARIGRLSPLSAPADAPFMSAFRQGLQELGWVEGRSFTIVSRFADGQPARLPHLAAAFAREGVDVILTGSNPGALAAKQATATIPIVMVTTGDPVTGGLVAGLARPGGNVTGVTALGQALSAKRLEVLKAARPGLQRIAVLVNPASPYTRSFLTERDATARELGVQLRVLEVREPPAFETAFTTLAAERTAGLMVLTDVMFFTHRTTLVKLAARHRLPTLYPDRDFVDAGGLMSYGASLADMYRRAATYVDRILKGARPADLPVEQPTTFELVVNLRTARALGLTLPQAFLQRADHVIE